MIPLQTERGSVVAASDSTADAIYLHFPASSGKRKGCLSLIEENCIAR